MSVTRILFCIVQLHATVEKNISRGRCLTSYRQNKVYVLKCFEKLTFPELCELVNDTNGKKSVGRTTRGNMQGIALAVMMAIGLAAFVYYRSTHRPISHSSANTTNDYHPTNSWTRATGSAQRRKKKNKNTECPICLEPILEHNTQALELPCDHWLHFDCGMQWMQQTRACPLCRNPA